MAISTLLGAMRKLVQYGCSTAASMNPGTQTSIHTKLRRAFRMKMSGALTKASQQYKKNLSLGECEGAGGTANGNWKDEGLRKKGLPKREHIMNGQTDELVQTSQYAGSGPYQ